MSQKTSEFAKQAKDFVTLQRNGMLSTLSKRENGFPFGSIAPYDVDVQGRIIIYLSVIAEHYHNLIADPRSSFLVADEFGISDPQSHPRATILTNFSEISSEEKKSIEESYARRFPESINYEIAHNFVFMRGEPLRIRWIGGFGEIGWVDGKQFRDVNPDPIAYIGTSLIHHMNNDHRDALQKVVKKHMGIAPAAHLIQMVSVCSKSFIIEATMGSEKKKVEVPFPFEVTSAEKAREAMVELVRSVNS